VFFLDTRMCYLMHALLACLSCMMCIMQPGPEPHLSPPCAFGGVPRHPCGETKRSNSWSGPGLIT
jgi:hypothetical protein